MLALVHDQRFLDSLNFFCLVDSRSERDLSCSMDSCFAANDEPHFLSFCRLLVWCKFLMLLESLRMSVWKFHR